MSDTKLLQAFQEQVGKLLVRHRSILDATSKFQETNARVNRAVMKCVTECGCIRIQASKQDYDVKESIQELIDKMNTHIEGKLCSHCEEILIAELGKNLFYMLGLMNILGIPVQEVIAHEQNQMNTLGMFNLT